MIKDTKDYNSERKKKREKSKFQYFNVSFVELFIIIIINYYLFNFLR